MLIACFDELVYHYNKGHKNEKHSLCTIACWLKQNSWGQIEKYFTLCNVASHLAALVKCIFCFRQDDKKRELPACTPTLHSSLRVPLFPPTTHPTWNAGSILYILCMRQCNKSPDLKRNIKYLKKDYIYSNYTYKLSKIIVIFLNNTW